MTDKGEIISSHDVDGNITLQIWTRGATPRLVIFNRMRDSKKLIRLAWLEKTDRKLSVKGQKKGTDADYTLEELFPVLRRILAEYAVYTSFKTRLWTFALTLEKILHAPAAVTQKAELSLLPEGKRSSLWIADLTDGVKGEGVFRPFFPLSDTEKKAMNGEALSFTENRRNAEDLFKTGVPRALSAARPDRWFRSVRLMATAMLLGFSFCGEDGSEFTDILWGRDNDGKTPDFRNNDSRLLGLGHKFISFARHFDALKNIAVRTSPDSDKELQDEAYVRKRRLEFPQWPSGGMGYSVTFFEHENGMMALGCKPKMRTSAAVGEQIYVFPAALYAQALADDAFGGAHDDYYTVMQLVAAKSFANWLDRVSRYIIPFAGFDTRG